MPHKDLLLLQATELLQKLIAIPSLSREENLTADCIADFLSSQAIPTERLENNVWAVNKHFDSSKPSILLNSHHDTVKANASYSRNPFEPLIEDGKLFGLGSNDAGGPLVCLLTTFTYYFDKENLPFNLVMAATAEEEISGKNGVELLIPHLPKIAFGIVGEPTSLDLAIAEKGLLVIDCLVKGKAGHAAREEGENAIYKAMKDIQWFQKFKFPETSSMLGDMKMSLTVINAGSQHNVVPDECRFTVDVRVTDAYTLEETLEIIDKNTSCIITPRSVRLQSSGINLEHPLVLTARDMGMRLYGSPTLSDQALMSFETVKLGPGDSARSHTADEFIKIDELASGIATYIKLLEGLAKKMA